MIARVAFVVALLTTGTLGLILGPAGSATARGGVSVTTPASRKAFVASTLATLAAPVAALAAPKVYETDDGVLYIVKEEGRGQSPRAGDYCVVSYVAYLNNGNVWDAIDAPIRKHIAFKLGQKQVIPGWESILPYMKPGATFNIVVPPKLVSSSFLNFTVHFFFVHGTSLRLHNDLCPPQCFQPNTAGLR